jgi:hypothetical protein
MAILGGSSVPLLISIVIFEKIDSEKRKIEIKNTLRLILIGRKL